MNLIKVCAVSCTIASVQFLTVKDVQATTYTLKSFVAMQPESAQLNIVQETARITSSTESDIYFISRGGMNPKILYWTAVPAKQLENFLADRQYTTSVSSLWHRLRNSNVVVKSKCADVQYYVVASNVDGHLYLFLLSPINYCYEATAGVDETYLLISQFVNIITQNEDTKWVADTCALRAQATR